MNTLKRWHWAHLALLALIVPATLLTLSLKLAPTVVLAFWLVVNVVVLGVAERLRPYRKAWHATPQHLRRDGTVWALNLVADAAVGALLVASAIAWLPGANAWPLPLQIVMGLAAAEFGSYWLHRWSHTDSWLWRVHLLHHVPDRLNLANAITAHPINAAYDKAARLLPLLVLGLSPDAMLFIALFGVTQSLVTHANVAGTIGWLDRVIGSAELHRRHHSTDPDQAGNFGTALPLWDQVFGTYRRQGAPSEVGVFHPAQYPGELELARLLRWPFSRRRFRWRLKCCSA
jgi:sterol desaturase/sphingolipid hydroxylase (fatty acid hydroxylase superfamily)